jgi:hypothetical protein
MEVTYKQRAANAINKVVYFIENNNTEGSGMRWFEHLDDKINSLAKSNIRLQLCRYKTLARYNYNCFYYKGWVIAYRISQDKLEVYRFIWNARLP